MKVCTARDFEIPNKLLITINEHPRAKRERERERGRERERANVSCCSGSMELGTKFVGTLTIKG